MSPDVSCESLTIQMDRWVKEAESLVECTRYLRSEIDSALKVNYFGNKMVHYSLLPALKIHNNSVICNGKIIDFQKHRLGLKLFQVFMERPRHAFTREELVMEIYESSMRLYSNPRWSYVINQNLVKLISRTRMIADRSVNSDTEKWIEWFSFSTEDKKWSFYRLTNNYLAEREKLVLNCDNLPTADTMLSI